MERIQSVKFWNGIKKKRKLRNILFSIFAIPAFLLAFIAFFSETPEVYILAVIPLFFSLLFFTAFYLSEKKIKQIINKLSPEETNLFSYEMENEKTLYYDKANLFLTEHYIILGNHFEIINYSDIVWIYHITVNYGIQGGRQLNVYTKNHKIHPIITSPFGKGQEIHLEIMNHISSKNSNILKGYTPENIKIMAEAKQEYKKSL